MPLDELPARIADICNEHATLEGPLLPILHAVQAEFGHIPQAAIDPIARALNISRAEVHGVVTFYHDFREEPVAAKVVKLCRSEACQARGAQALGEWARRMLATDWIGATTPGNGVTVEDVYCLGLCACGPAAMVTDAEGTRLHARLDEPLMKLLCAGTTS